MLEGLLSASGPYSSSESRYQQVFLHFSACMNDKAPRGPSHKAPCPPQFWWLPCFLMTDCVISSIVTADKAFQIQFVLLKEPPPCSTACPPHLGDTGVDASCLEAGCLAERRGQDGKTARHLATAIDSCPFSFKCKTYNWGPGCLGLWSLLMCCPL